MKISLDKSGMRESIYLWNPTLISLIHISFVLDQPRNPAIADQTQETMVSLVLTNSTYLWNSIRAYTVLGFIILRKVQK